MIHYKWEVDKVNNVIYNNEYSLLLCFRFVWLSIINTNSLFQLEFVIQQQTKLFYSNFRNIFIIIRYFYEGRTTEFKKHCQNFPLFYILWHKIDFSFNTTHYSMQICTNTLCNIQHWTLLTISHNFNTKNTLGAFKKNYIFHSKVLVS